MSANTREVWLAMTQCRILDSRIIDTPDRKLGRQASEELGGSVSNWRLEPIEVAHIIPFSMGRQSGQYHFMFWVLFFQVKRFSCPSTIRMFRWCPLRTIRREFYRHFWTADRTDAWKWQIFGNDGVVVCQNLSTLSRCAQKPKTLYQT